MFVMIPVVLDFKQEHRLWKKTSLNHVHYLLNNYARNGFDLTRVTLE